MAQEKHRLIRIASPNIKKTDIRQATEVIRSGKLVQGENVLAFEKALCSFTSIDNCAVVSSGTAALHLALLALDIHHGDTVIVPAFTFPATANVVENVGANVILCDVDARSYVMTPESVYSILCRNSKKTIKAIIIVHEFGYPAEIKEIFQIARKYNLKIIEDAACALGTIADGHHVGYYSDVACFSFHPRKAITTGEGGALISNDITIIEKSRMLRNHGISHSNNKTDFVKAGLNYRITDFQAALAIGQLERFTLELKRRKTLANHYRSLLQNRQNLSLTDYKDGHSWQSYMVVLNETINRSTVINRLLNDGIETTLGAQALNCLDYYQKKYHTGDNTCPIATKLYNQGLVLPLYGSLRKDIVTEICEKFLRYI